MFTWLGGCACAHWPLLRVLGRVKLRPGDAEDEAGGAVDVLGGRVAADREAQRAKREPAESHRTFASGSSAPPPRVTTARKTRPTTRYKCTDGPSERENALERRADSAQHEAHVRLGRVRRVARRARTRRALVAERREQRRRAHAAQPDAARIVLLWGQCRTAVAVGGRAARSVAHPRRSVALPGGEALTPRCEIGSPQTVPCSSTRRTARARSLDHEGRTRPPIRRLNATSAGSQDRPAERSHPSSPPARAKSAPRLSTPNDDARYSTRFMG